MRLRVIQPAPPDTRYAPGAFDSAIGQRFPLVNTFTTLLAAEVAEDGSSVEFELELPDGWTVEP